MNKSKKYVRTIIRIPDDLWNEIKNILPNEKPENTIGRPIVHTEKYLMVSCLSLELDVSGKCYLKSMVLVPHATEDFRNERIRYI